LIAFENVRLRLLAEPFQAGDLAVLAGLFELLDRFGPPSSSCSALIFFGPTRDVEHRHESGGSAAFRSLVVLQAARGDEFGDLLLGARRQCL